MTWVHIQFNSNNLKLCSNYFSDKNHVMYELQNKVQANFDQNLGVWQPISGVAQLLEVRWKKPPVGQARKQVTHPCREKKQKEDEKQSR